MFKRIAGLVLGTAIAFIVLVGAAALISLLTQSPIVGGIGLLAAGALTQHILGLH